MTRPRFLAVLSFMVLLVAPAFGQVVTSDPSFPTISTPVTVYFHADRGNEGLKDFTGEIYAHTGVITNLSTGPSAWRYVKTPWSGTGANTAANRLTRVEPNLYRLDIGDIRSYYGVPASEQILRLAFVFRNADASRTGRDTNGADIFLEIFEETAGVNVRFSQPSVSALTPLILKEPGDVAVAVEASAMASQLTSIELFVNGQSVSTTATSPLEYTVTISGAGRSLVKAVASNDQGVSSADSFFVTVNPPVVDQAVPSGMRDGINYHEDDPSRVTMVLYAPNKEFVYAIGDFNDWQVDPAFFLKRDQSGSEIRWWITLDGLTPGQEYGFQYLIDGTLRMADLFSEKILDPWNDHFIPASTYPNLKPYPAGKTEQIVTVLQPGRARYQWRVPNFQRPPQHELVIYELLLRDFIAARNFETLTDTLGYLQRLGINAIELMPVSEFDGNLSWGYNPAFHLALDKAYGTRDAFKRFVDEAHSRGIAVILDVVYNHATGSSPLVRLYGASATSNPFLGPGHQWNVFHHLNHDNEYVRYWLQRANEYWLTEYNVDGYRFDLTKGFASNVNNSTLLNGYNAQRIANLKRMADAMWAVDPTSYVILEHFAPNNEEQELAHYRRNDGKPGMMLWGNLNHAYNQATMGYQESSNFSGGYFRARGWTAPNLITYMESHDEQWLMFKNLRFGNSSGTYNVRNLETALARQAMVGAFFFTIPGPKMLWQFGELGYGGGPQECLKPGSGNGDCLASDPGRTAQKPIRWNYYNEPARKAVYDTWSGMLSLRNGEIDLFRNPDTQVTQALATNVKQLNLRSDNGAGNIAATIVGNFGVTPLNATVNFPLTGTWYDAMTGHSFEVTSTTETRSLEPGQYHIFLNTRYIVNTDEGTVPGTFSLGQNYPNPFNPSTSINFSIDRSAHVRLSVFDMLGRRVALLADEPRTAGSYSVSFDASHLPSGTYVYRLEAGNRSETRTMVLVK